MSTLTETAGASLSGPKQSVALLLAAGRSMTAAAREAGVHRSTVHAWLREDPEFAAAVESARLEFVGSLRDKLRDLAVLALDALTDLLSRPDTPASVRLRTALAILERPQFPSPGWNLPLDVDQVPASAGPLLAGSAVSEPGHPPAAVLPHADLGGAGTASQPAPSRHSPTLLDTLESFSQAAPRRPRNSPCPCGSGRKYKRCCGASAPPVIGTAA